VDEHVGSLDRSRRFRLAEPAAHSHSAPGEKWSPGEGFGNTPLEEAMGETLDQRIAQEVEEPDPYEEAERLPIEVIEGREESEVTELSEAGDERAGRLDAYEQQRGLAVVLALAFVRA
jgi:hypothetical protein